MNDPVIHGLTRQLAANTLQLGFLALVRSEDAWYLMRDRNAFVLLAYIAWRVRYTDHYRDGLGAGQMFMGRDSAAKELRMTPGEVREATKRLIAASRITCRPTSLGTVVTLIDSAVYDIPGARNNQPNASEATNEQPANNQRTTTNEEGKKEKGKNHTFVAETIYETYPRKQGKQDALKAIKAALVDCSPERLLERTQAYAAATTNWSEADRKFIPHPATWYNRGSYDDDPAEWIRNGPQEISAAYQQF